MSALPKSLAFFAFTGFGGQNARGLGALDQKDRLILTDAEDNPGTSMTNAIENAVGPARRELGAVRGGQVLLWTPDDPVAPDSVWEVTFTSHGAEYGSWDQMDEELLGALSALGKARGRDAS